MTDSKNNSVFSAFSNMKATDFVANPKWHSKKANGETIKQECPICGAVVDNPEGKSHVETGKHRIAILANFLQELGYQRTENENETAFQLTPETFMAFQEMEIKPAFLEAPTDYDHRCKPPARFENWVLVK